MTEFTPMLSLAGGAMIGAAAVLLIAFHGRIAGIRGMLVRLLPPFLDDAFAVRLAFVSGLLLAPLALGMAAGSPVHQTVGANLPVMAVAGLLVGFGSVFGSGCTSGHGVCGMARLSARSLAATGIFMTVAAATVFVVRHGLGA